MKPNNLIRVIAAVVDVYNLTLYKSDGDTIAIPQGDPRVRRIVQEVTPQLLEHSYAMVDVGIAEDNQYLKFEEESSGVVKFFRVAKAVIKNLFVDEPEENTGLVPAMSIGPVPKPQQATTIPIPLASVLGSLPDMELTPAIDHINTAGIYDVTEQDEVDAAYEQSQLQTPVVEDKHRHTMAAVNEIMKHAVPASSPSFHEEDVAKQGNVVEDNGITDSQKNEQSTESHTIIAVVDGKVIPGMEKIKTQFSRAAKLGSTLGVENFLKRLASVIEKRSHSVEDLLKFMERGDLPIANDGSILIYKVLKRVSNHTTGKFVDCHTGNVEQWVGAYVCMDESLVDRNRSNECSNGLHVARRGYIRNFSGSVCVLAKLAPEDVIAVPEYDANKMRVCGYHIIMELSDKQYSLIKQNKPLTDDEEGKYLLACAIAGNHVQKTHEVRITAQKGGGIKVTKLSTLNPVEEPVVKTEAEAIGNPDKEMLDAPVNPLDVVKSISALSVKGQAAVMHEDVVKGVPGAVEKLMVLKKQSKKSWAVLGVPCPVQPGLKGLPVSTKTPPMPTIVNPVVKGKDFNKKVKKIKQAKAKVKDKMPPEVIGPETKIYTNHDDGFGSARERIQKLLAIGLTSVGVADAILSLKKQSKKSWTVLGVNEAQVTVISRQTSTKK